MIENKFINDLLKEFQVKEYLSNSLKNVGFSHSKLQRTPMGEKIIIYAARPGLVVGRKGENIQMLTRALKLKFKFENPQIEIVEIEKPNLNAPIVAERIASSLERFGVAKFKGIAHKVLVDVMDSGARGIEITISGKVPSTRAKRWRFFQGYLKKSGDIAVSGVKVGITQAALKSGIIGVQVRILPPDVMLPDTVTKKEIQTLGDVAVIKGSLDIKKSEPDHKDKKGAKAKKAKKAPAKKKEDDVKVEEKASEEKNEEEKSDAE